MAQLESNLSLDARLRTGEGPNHEVICLAVDQDGRMVIGGNFTTVGGKPRNRVARLKADGKLDPSFNPGAGADLTVWCVAVTSDGSILVRGDFAILFNKTAHHGLVRLKPDGALDPTFDAKFIQKSGNQGLRAILLEPDGRILVGGPFVGIGGSSQGAFARLNPGRQTRPHLQNQGGRRLGRVRQATGRCRDAHRWRSLVEIDLICQNLGLAECRWKPGSEFCSLNVEMDGPVWSGDFQSDGKIVIGGKFTRSDRNRPQPYCPAKCRRCPGRPSKMKLRRVHNTRHSVSPGAPPQGASRQTGAARWYWENVNSNENMRLPRP